MLARVAALEAAAPRATTAMFKAAAESLARFYEALDAAAAPASLVPPRSSFKKKEKASSPSLGDALAVKQKQKPKRVLAERRAAAGL